MSFRFLVPCCVLASTMLLRGADLVVSNPFPGFSPTRVVATATAPQFLTAADLNGDGLQDLVAVSRSGELLVLLQEAPSTFRTALILGLNVQPSAVAVTTAANASAPGLAIATENRTVLFLPGTGDGTFGPATTSNTSNKIVSLIAGKGIAGEPFLSALDETGTAYAGRLDPINHLVLSPVAHVAGATALAVGDFDGGGVSDVAIASVAGIDIAFGRADGTYGALLPVSVRSGISGLFPADLNGTGRPSLIGTSQEHAPVLVTVGTDRKPSSFEISTLASGSASAGDIDGDGKSDLVVVGKPGNSLLIYRGLGNGKFAPSPVVELGSNATAVVAAQGLVAASDSTAGTVSATTLPAAASSSARATQGSGLITQALGAQPLLPQVVTPIRIHTDAASTTVTLSASANPVTYGKSVTLTAVVGPNTATGKVTFYDGITPIGIAPVSGGTANFATILLQPGHRSITARYDGDANDTPSTSSPYSLTVNDFAVLSFANEAQFSGGTQTGWVLTGDFNKDGKLDLVTLAADYFGNGYLEFLAGNGFGSFAAPVQTNTDLAPYAAVAADFNGDGNLDIAVTAASASGSSTEIDVFLGNGNGTFQSYVPYAVVPTVPGALIESLGIAAADFNRDGVVDLVVVNGNDNSMTVFLGNGNGTFGAGITTPICTNCSSDTPNGEYPVAVAVGDFNRDGIPDIATANDFDGTCTILLGNGSGGFTLQSQSPFFVGDNPTDILAFDTNGDGYVDLVFSNSTDNQVAVILGNGNGTFQWSTPQTFDVGFIPAGMVVGDFNGDLIPDVAVVNTVDATFNVLDGKTGGGFTVTGPFGPACTPGDCTWVQPAVGDFNGDGISDVAIADQGDLLPPPDSFPGVVDVFLGQGCAFTVSPNSIAFPNSGGTVPVFISATSNSCQWTASSTVPWVAVTPTTGIANQTALTVIVQPNSTGVAEMTTITIAGQSVPVTAWSTQQVFSDVPPSNGFFDAINLFSQYGITSGCSANPPDYCPDQDVTRAQMAVFLVKAIYGDQPFTLNQQTPYFNDVPEGSFAYDFIQKLYELGITSGCGDGNYCPNENVTRAEMAVFIIKMRYEQVPFTFSSTPYFSDVPVGAFAFDFIQRMAQDSITSGCGTGIYCPNNDVTRGEMAVFMMRAAFNQLLPAGTPVISSISPNTISPGQMETITVTGVNTAFASGSTIVEPPAGFTVGSVVVNSPTSLTVSLTAGTSVPVQPESIVVETGSQQAILPNGLLVQ